MIKYIDYAYKKPKYFTILIFSPFSLITAGMLSSAIPRLYYNSNFVPYLVLVAFREANSGSLTELIRLLTFSDR